MDDKVNTSQEYAGPPKSYNFKDNAEMGQGQESPQAAQPKTASKNTGEIDLLSMITAGDKKPVAPVKQKKKFNVNISINLKEVNAYKRKVHEYIKKQSHIWKKLNVVWMIFKTLFYLLGIGFFAVCLFFYFHFESVVRTYLQKRNLENVSVESVEYSRVNDILTITFNNIKEKNNLFSISKINLSFSFAGLLDKKIQMVGLDGLRLFPHSQKTLAQDFQSLTSVLSKLGLFGGPTWFSIQSLRLDNSVMYIRSGVGYTPVSLTGVGNLTGKKTLILPISFDGETASASADVKMEFSSSDDISWTVDILSGSVALPAMEKQAMKGKINAKTVKGDVLSASFTGTLTKDGIDKDVVIQLAQNRKKSGYDLKSQCKIKNGDPTSIEFNAFNLVFDDNLSSFNTDSQIYLQLSNVKVPNASFETIKFNGVAGKLFCNFDGCSYSVGKDGEIVFFSPTYRWLETAFSAALIRLPLIPTKEKTFSFDKKGVNFNFDIGKTEISARKSRLTREASTTIVSLKNMKFNAKYTAGEKTLSGTSEINVDSLADDTIGVSNGVIKTRFTDASHYTTIEADKMSFNETPYFKVPASVRASFDNDYYFVADLDALDGKMSLSVNGYYYPYTGEVIMGVKANKPIVFDDKTPNPFEISELFSSDIKNLRGKVDLKGEIHYSNLRSVSGPLKVLLDDVSFDYGNMQVRGLNSVLNLTHIVPLGAQGVQELYVSSVNTYLPFEDISAQVIFDAPRKQFNLSSLDTTLAGYHLRADPMWYGYGSQSYMLSLKGKPVPMENILGNVNIPDLKITGNGSLSISSQIKGDKFTLRHLELSIPSEGVINYTPEKYTSPYLENLKSLDFKRLNAYLTQQGESFEFVFSADNKVSKVKKKTSFRLNLKNALKSYLKPSKTQKVIPNTILKEKDSF